MDCKKVMKWLKRRRDEKSIARYREEVEKLTEVYVQHEIFLEAKVKTVVAERGGS